MRLRNIKGAQEAIDTSEYVVQEPEESVVEEAKPEESVAEEIKPEENSVPATESETTQSDSANVQAPTPLSTEEQIRLLVDSKDVWYQEKSDKENSKIYYLVTDLDMNDRIEIIRCDYCALPEFCKNRFLVQRLPVLPLGNHHCPRLPSLPPPS